MTFTIFGQPFSITPKDTPSIIVSLIVAFLPLVILGVVKYKESKRNPEEQSSGLEMEDGPGSPIETSRHVAMLYLAEAILLGLYLFIKALFSS